MKIYTLIVHSRGDYSPSVTTCTSRKMLVETKVNILNEWIANGLVQPIDIEDANERLEYFEENSNGDHYFIESEQNINIEAHIVVRVTGVDIEVTASTDRAKAESILLARQLELMEELNLDIPDLEETFDEVLGETQDLNKIELFTVKL